MTNLEALPVRDRPLCRDVFVDPWYDFSLEESIVRDRLLSNWG